MQKTKACLFGGALFAAGLAGTAQAVPEFNWGYVYAGYTFAYGGDGAFGAAFSGNLAAGAYVNAAYTQPYLDALAVAAWDNTYHYVLTYAYTGYGYASVDAFIPGYGGAGYAIYHYFNVTEDAFFNLDWDFSGATAALVAVIDFTNAAILFANYEGSAGTLSIALDAANDYALVYVQIADGFLTGTQVNFHNATLSAIPAPASAALLGLMGLAGTRRRR